MLVDDLTLKVEPGSNLLITGTPSNRLSSCLVLIIYPFNPIVCLLTALSHNFSGSFIFFPLGVRVLGGGGGTLNLIVKECFLAVLFRKINQM